MGQRGRSLVARPRTPPPSPPHPPHPNLPPTHLPARRPPTCPPPPNRPQPTSTAIRPAPIACSARLEGCRLGFGPVGDLHRGLCSGRALANRGTARGLRAAGSTHPAAPHTPARHQVGSPSGPGMAGCNCPSLAYRWGWNADGSGSCVGPCAADEIFVGENTGRPVCTKCPGARMGEGSGNGQPATPEGVGLTPSAALRAIGRRKQRSAARPSLAVACRGWGLARHPTSSRALSPLQLSSPPVAHSSPGLLPIQPPHRTANPAPCCARPPRHATLPHPARPFITRPMQVAATQQPTAPAATAAPAPFSCASPARRACNAPATTRGLMTSARRAPRAAAATAPSRAAASATTEAPGSVAVRLAVSRECCFGVRLTRTGAGLGLPPHANAPQGSSAAAATTPRARRYRATASLVAADSARVRSRRRAVHKHPVLGLQPPHQYGDLHRLPRRPHPRRHKPSLKRVQ
jgi:hypothetical protein